MGQGQGSRDVNIVSERWNEYAYFYTPTICVLENIKTYSHLCLLHFCHDRFQEQAVWTHGNVT